MKSPLGALVRTRNTPNGPPIPLSATTRAMRGLTFNLGAGKASRETMMRQYGTSGTIYGIISLLSEAAATPTWHLYKKTPVDGRRRYTTGDQGSDQRIEVVQHAAIQLWNNPNDFHSGFEFREGAQQHEELTGETFWVLDTEAGFPTSMWYVRPDRMEPVPDPDLYLTGWIYTGPSGEQVPLKNSEVILERRPDPLDPYRGAGPVASILPNIQQQRYATEYQRNLFLNGADPGGIITVPNQLSEPEFDELIDRWRESHRGVARAGHVGVLEGGAVWTPNTHTNKDMEYGTLRLANRDELREAWRIHKAMMGTSDDVNRANAETAQEIFVAQQTKPRLNRRRDTLNTKLLPLFARADKTVEFDYDDPSPENAEAAALELREKAQAAQALVTAGYDEHDVLEVVGLPDMKVAVKATQAPALPPGWVPESPTPPTGPASTPTAREHITIRAAATQQPPTQPPAQLQAVDNQWKNAVALLTTAWLAAVIPGWTNTAVNQIRDHVKTGNLTALAAITLNTTIATQLLLDHLEAYANTSAQQAAAEAAAAGHPDVQPTTPPQADLAALAATTAALAAGQFALTAGREAARLAAGPHPDPEQVAEQTRRFLTGLSDTPVTAMASGVMSAAQNTARLATIEAGPRAQLLATERHDRNTCGPCDKIDGTSFGYSDDPDAVATARAAYPAGGYIGCEGGPRCRGTIYADYTAARTTPSAAWSTRPRADTAPLPVLSESDMKPLAALLRQGLNGQSLNGHSRGARV